MTKADGEVVTAAYRTVFIQPSAAGVAAQWDSVAATFQSTHPKVAAVMDDAREDVLAVTAFPAGALEEHLVDQPVGSAEHEGQAPHRCGGGFPR